MKAEGRLFYKANRLVLIAAIVLPFALPFFSQTGNSGPARKLPFVVDCKGPAGSRNAEILKRAGIVSGILEELAVERERFLKKGDPADLFPTLYFNVSRIEFAHVLASDADVRPEMLDMIITFYDAYRANRDAFDKGGRGAVESHWKSYYRGAAEARKSGSNSMATIAGLILSGVDAHLDDLSRTIRYEFARSPGKKDAIVEAYNKMDPLFAEASRLANDDIIEGMKTASTLRSLDSTFKFGETYVIHARHRAMERALSPGKLKIKSPQPKLLHPDTSRKYFEVIRPDEPCS